MRQGRCIESCRCVKRRRLAEDLLLHLLVLHSKQRRGLIDVAGHISACRHMYSCKLLRIIMYARYLVQISLLSRNGVIYSPHVLR